MPGFTSFDDPLPGLGLFTAPERPCPTSTLTGHIKQLSRVGLSAFEIGVLNAVFSGFLDGVMTPGPELARYKRAAEEHGMPYQHDDRVLRRFDGDRTLPQGCYSALCDEHGDDHGTLARELRYYFSAKTAGGHVEVHDLSTGEVPGIYLTPGPRIALQCFPFAQNGSKADAHALLIALDLRVSSVCIENVLDLRRPDAANWFSRTISRLQLDIHGTRLPCFNRLPLDTFPEIIFGLLDQCRGGGNLHIIAGLYLRRLGISGLVYPSARSDVSVAFRGGEPLDWRGWSFLDYQTAPTPALFGFYEERPGWPVNLVSEGGDGSEPHPVAFSDQVYIITTSYQEQDGGFRVDGLERRGEVLYIAGSVEEALRFRVPQTAERYIASFHKFIITMSSRDAIILARMMLLALLGVQRAQSDLVDFVSGNAIPPGVTEALLACTRPMDWASPSVDGYAEALSRFSGLEGLSTSRS